MKILIKKKSINLIVQERMGGEMREAEGGRRGGGGKEPLHKNKKKT